MLKMNTMKQHEWKEEFNVNVEFIDEQHKYFLNLLNLLIRIVKGEESVEKASEVFFSLAHYAEHYLIQEEIYFKNYQFPKFSEHQEAHKEFIDRVTKFQHDFEMNKENNCRELLEYLEDWFNNHILGYDTDAILFLRSKGL
jgi:hemerythrin